MGLGGSRWVTAQWHAPPPLRHALPASAAQGHCVQPVKWHQGPGLRGRHAPDGALVRAADHLRRALQRRRRDGLGGTGRQLAAPACGAATSGRLSCDDRRQGVVASTELVAKCCRAPLCQPPLPPPLSTPSSSPPQVRARPNVITSTSGSRDLQMASSSTHAHARACACVWGVQSTVSGGAGRGRRAARRGVRGRRRPWPTPLLPATPAVPQVNIGLRVLTRPMADRLPEIYRTLGAAGRGRRSTPAGAAGPLPVPTSPHPHPPTLPLTHTLQTTHRGRADALT